jgi:hypothetical protein
MTTSTSEASATILSASSSDSTNFSSPDMSADWPEFWRKQASHIRTGWYSCSEGRGRELLEQSPQTRLPQLRQWCLRRPNQNVVWQLKKEAQC